MANTKKKDKIKITKQLNIGYLRPFIAQLTAGTTIEHIVDPVVWQSIEIDCPEGWYFETSAEFTKFANELVKIAVQFEKALPKPSTNKSSKTKS